MMQNDDKASADDAPQEAERLITTEEAAALLGVAANTLAKGRMEANRRHPPHVKIGRSVRYSTRELSAFIRSRTEGGTLRNRRR
jgi:predicted DNA-binding transcriptional regulator AlpA